MSPDRPLMRGVLRIGDVRFEKMIGDRFAQALVEPSVVTEIRQDDFRQDEKRDHLHQHQDRRLQRDVRRFAPANPRDPKEHDAEAVTEGVIKGAGLKRDGERAEERRTVRHLRLKPAA